MADQSKKAQDNHDEVYQLIMAAWGSQAVRTLAALSVAEHLKHGPLSAQQIAERESSDPEATYRVLRAGAALGLLEYNTDTDVFRSTAKLQVLHEDAPVSLKHYAQASSGPAFWLPAVYLPQVVASGCNHSDKALGCSPFEYFAQHKDEARQFSEAMTDLSTPVIRDAVSVIDVGDARIVVDVGGANGAFACELVQCSSQVSALVLELPHVVAGVAEEAGQRGLEDKVTGVPGDFFVSVPSGDLYLLKFVLHNWDDEACVKILSNIRRAMRPGARLVIVEMAVATSGATASAALMDMAMLFALNGQERELPQFEELLRRAGLRSTRVIAIRSPYYVIEAEVASSDSTSHRNNGRWSPKRVRPGPGQGIA